MKPDQQAYNAEMEEVKKLIEEVKVKVVSLFLGFFFC